MADGTVMRTIYLPMEMDREIREIAASEDWASKGELICELVRRGLESYRPTREQTFAEKLGAESIETMKRNA